MTDKSATLRIEEGLENAVVGWLKRALEAEVIDAVLIPVEVPAGDSYAYLLVSKPSVLDGARPLPPVMPIQGGRVLSRLTARGSGETRIAAVIRPCEARAAVELEKLEQVDLENLLLITLDCPGVMPLSDYLADPAAGATRFAEAAAAGDREPMRPTCQVCNHFSLTDAPESDLHIGYFGVGGDTAFLVPATRRGEEFLEAMDASLDNGAGGWKDHIADLTAAQTARHEESLAGLQERISRPAGLMDVLSSCINCHNCQRVCPVCYCRQCYFESPALKLDGDNYLARARRKGALRMAPDTLLFHLGRASHMILSCVSCGACEDACPMDIPVGQLFSLLADQAQSSFEYIAGARRHEPLPLVDFAFEEFRHVEKTYDETYEPEVQRA